MFTFALKVGLGVNTNFVLAMIYLSVRVKKSPVSKIGGRKKAHEDNSVGHGNSLCAVADRAALQVERSLYAHYLAFGHGWRFVERDVPVKKD